MTKLVELNKKDLASISDKDAANFILKSKGKGNEPFLKIKDGAVINIEDDPVLELEVALRQCERTGFFNK